MNINKKPWSAENYNCIGGVDGIDVWVRASRSGDEWDSMIVFSDNSVHKFDIYLTRDKRVSSYQRAAVSFLLTDGVAERLTHDKTYRILLMVKLFAPRLFTSTTNPQIARFMAKMEKQHASA